MTATTHRLRDRWPETGSYDLIRVVRDTRANNRVVEVHLTTIPAETAEQAMQAAIRWLDSRWQSHGTRWAKVPGRTGSWALRGPMVCGRPRHLLSSDGMCELCRPKRGPRPAGRCGDQVVVSTAGDTIAAERAQPGAPPRNRQDGGITVQED